MGYFGGGGVTGSLHPSLRAYIDCFLSSPFPKLYPRKGGPWDQDPHLMRDFRSIRKHELQWKEAQRQLDEVKNQTGNEMGGGSFDLEDLLDEATSNLDY